MKNLFNFRGISGIALTVFLTIVLLLSIYFFVRINRNERDLQERGFNVLNQLNSAIQEKDRTLKRVAENLKIDYGSKINANIEKLIDTIASDNKFLAGRGISLSRNEVDYESKSYAVNESEQKRLRIKEIFMNIGYNGFLNPLLRNDFLSHYVLIEKRNHNNIGNDLLVYSSFPFRIELSRSDVENSIAKSAGKQSVLINSGNPDSIASSIFQAGAIRKVNIQGMDYELFLIPVKIGVDNYYLGGFIEEKSYLSMKRGLDSTTIFIFIMVLIVTLFSLPILKILLIGPLEKLNRINITMAGISMVIGVIILVILITISYIIFRSKDAIQINLDQLNDSITRSFIEESGDLLKQMIDYDRSLNLVPGTSINAVLNRNDKYVPTKMRHFKTFFWVDSADMQIMQISSRENAGALTRLSNREYVKNYSKWLWENFDGKNEQCWYNVEPIFSNVTGEWLLAYSTRSDKEYEEGKKNTTRKAKLMGITSNMYSLQDAILPDGYEFCLVDNKAKVWYHSSNQLYMNEDILNACNNNQRLTAAIHSGVSDNLTVKLHGKIYYVSVKAIDNTQLFMITMCNPFSIKLFAVQASFFLFIALVLVFIMLMMLHLATKGLLHRHSNLAGKRYFFNWLIPDNNEEKKYLTLFTGNILVSVCLLLYSLTEQFKGLPPDTVVLLLVSLITLNFSLSFIFLQKNDMEDSNLKSPGSSFFLFKLFGKKNNWFEDIGKKIIYITPLLLILLIIDIIAYRLNGFDSSMLSILFSQAFVLVIYIIFFIFIRVSTRITKLKLHSYILFIYSWLAISAIIPSFLIFKKTFQFEFRTYIANQQISLAQKINDKTEKIYKFYSGAIPTSSPEFIKERLDKGNYYGFFHGTICKPIDESKSETGLYKPANEFFLTFSRISHYYYNFLMGEKDILEVNQQIIDNTGFNEKKASLFLTFNRYEYDSTMARIYSKNAILSQTDYINFNPLKNNAYTTFYWLTSLIFFILIFQLMRIIIRKLFDFSSLNCKSMISDEAIKQLVQMKISGIIVDINHIDLDNYSFENHKNFNLSKDDIENLELKPEERLIVTGLDNVEDVKYFETLVKKLEQLHNNYSNRLTILLFTSPNLLMEMEECAAKKYDDKEKTSLKLDQIYRLNKVFANLLVLYSGKIQETDNEENNDLSKFVKNELNLDSYTQKLRPIMNYYIKNEALDNIEITTLKIQELALTHYIFLWYNLSFREKFVLYDLARDSVVNLQNKDILNSLLGKGLIKCNGEIEFTSLSFKNFILTVADKTGIEKEQARITSSGNWNKLKSPLIIIVASIIVFLFATQISFLSNLYTVLISLGTLLGVFIKFSGMFKSSGS